MSNDYLVFTENSGIEFDNFKPLSTFKVAFFQFIFTCSLEVLVVVLLLTRENLHSTCGEIIVLLFSQTALWLITFIFDHYYHACHYKLRLYGHFHQHKKLNKISTCFLYIVSFCSAIIIATIGLLLQIYSGNICFYHNFVSPTYIIFYIFTIQFVCLIPNIISYMISVSIFNQLRPLSDIERHECWVSHENQTTTEVGYRLESEAITSFLEKQADLIQYYKIANNDLSKRLENVHSTLQHGHNGGDGCAQQQSSGSPPQV